MKLKLQKLEEEILTLRKEINTLVSILEEKNTSKPSNENKLILNNNTKSKTLAKNTKKDHKEQKIQYEKNNVKNTKKSMENNSNKDLTSNYEQHKKVEEVVLQIKEKKYDEAIKSIDKFLNEVNDISTISILYYWKGEAYYYLKDYSKAIECFQKVLSFPKSGKKIEAQIMTAECYTRLGKLREAKREYQKFIEEYPFSEYAPRAKRMIQQL
ncbi:MAG: tetratricopeptide repeat protein [Ignavibacteria bacterium]|nr:tetratricopeptide repeat protein [Ignavibacteria bacterium]